MGKTGTDWRTVTLARRERRLVVRPQDETSRKMFLAFAELNGVANWVRLVVNTHGWDWPRVERFYRDHLSPYRTEQQKRDDLALMRNHVARLVDQRGKR